MSGNAAAAWRWRQLTEELDRRGAVSLDELQNELDRRLVQLQGVTSDLAECRAWAALLERTTLAERQALIGWKDVIRRIGKGTGKRAPGLRVAARKLLFDARNAVPVWIMPLARVVEAFDPRRTRFDVVIVDEASQADILALCALYLGRSVIVVGDHQQVSPAAIGQEVAEIEQLIRQHLEGIPNAVLYDGKTSIYDIARQSFGGMIRLREHFRCIPDIIQFSNHLSYEGEIQPLREASSSRLLPAVVSYRTTGRRGEGSKTNDSEARAISALLSASLEQQEYSGKSFGVVSLLGEDQAITIERILRQRINSDILRRIQLLCGNAAQFQGDERDVVFVSLVDSSEGEPLPRRDTDLFRQRFNVAASRARDQLWVVHSLDPKIDLKPGDLRRRLIEHADDPKALTRALEQEEKRTESEFERLVLRELMERGYRVRARWPVGGYRIDLVVVGGGCRLAVECDGERYHPIEKIAEDMERQAILERLGWRFVRIRGSVFFRDRETAIRPVLEAIERLEIPPVGPEERVSESELPAVLRNRVIKRAEEILAAEEPLPTGAERNTASAEVRSNDPRGVRSSDPRQDPDRFRTL